MLKKITTVEFLMYNQTDINIFYNHLRAGSLEKIQKI